MIQDYRLPEWFKVVLLAGSLAAVMYLSAFFYRYIIIGQWQIVSGAVYTVDENIQDIELNESYRLLRMHQPIEMTLTIANVPSFTGVGEGGCGCPFCCPV